MNSFHGTYTARYVATEPGVISGNGLWPWVSSPGCWHVCPELVWLREDGQAGSENVFGYKCSRRRVRTRACIPAGPVRGLGPSICAIPEVTGTLWELLGEVLASGRRPDRRVLTVLSGLEIKTSVMAGINALVNVL